MKHIILSEILANTALSEQHPREQGLKPSLRLSILKMLQAFRATSKRTRIETQVSLIVTDVEIQLSEQHPREQGLKHSTCYTIWNTASLSEQHPREQGLKLAYAPNTILIQEAFRATSKRTRIETVAAFEDGDVPHHFQSNIQENKD